MDNNFQKSIITFVNGTFLERVNFENLCRSRGIEDFPEDFRADENGKVVIIYSSGSLEYLDIETMYFLLKDEEAVVVSPNNLSLAFDEMGCPNYGTPVVVTMNDITRLYMKPGFNDKTLTTRSFLKYKNSK